MSEFRRLIVVGESPLATLAASIGIQQRGSGYVRVVELVPDQIAASELGFLADTRSDSTDVFAAIGLSALNYARFDLWAKLKLRGYRCAALVHPSANVDPSAILEDSVLVGPGATIEPEAHIGRGTIIGATACVGTGTRIGPWCWLARGVVVGALVEVGAHVVLGASVQLADRAVFPGPGEIDVPGTYRGALPLGTFVSPEFAQNAARLVRIR